MIYHVTATMAEILPELTWVQAFQRLAGMCEIETGLTNWRPAFARRAKERLNRDTCPRTDIYWAAADNAPWLDPWRIGELSRTITMLKLKRRKLRRRMQDLNDRFNALGNLLRGNERELADILLWRQSIARLP